jgi:Flp pilus assembly protein TadD/precorrin-6B methylase 2
MINKPLSPSIEELASQALALHQNGQFEDACTIYDQLLSDSPDNAEPLYFRGALATQMGDHNHALELLRKAAEGAPHIANIPYNIGIAQTELGRYGDAEQAYRQAIEIKADFADAFNNLGYVLQCKNQFDGAVEAYRQALAINEHYVAVRTNLALLLKQCGDLTGAVAEFKIALESDPENTSLQQDLQATYREMVPPWHFPMLNDQVRNDVYYKAISRAITPEDIVLDIGTGSGLLAMMAAKAGAKHIYACEVIKPVAEMARQIVKENGFADKISIIDKSSTILEIGRDLPEPATVLVSEILDIALLGEGVLPSLKHAKNYLITQNATIIPASAKVWGLLINCKNFKKLNTVESVHGFNLKSFNCFHHKSHGFDLEKDEHHALSKPFEVFSIDFKKLPDGPQTYTFNIPVISDGTAQAVVAWFDLNLFDDIEFSTRKGERHNHWRQIVFFLNKETAVKKGGVFTLSAGHTEKSLFFNVAE